MKQKIATILLPLLLVSGSVFFAYQKSQNPYTIKIDLKSGNLFFDPDVIHAKVGDMLEFNVTNDGQHTFVIEDPKTNFYFKRELTEKHVAFTLKVEEKGTFEYFCDISGHKVGGQKGTLIVE